MDHEASVRGYLLKELIPRHLGMDHMVREVISQSLSIPNAVFGNPEAERKTIVILDETHIYFQKSSNYYL